MRSAGGARDSRDDPEYGCEAVVGAVDRARDPAAAGAVPALAPEDPIESGARTRNREPQRAAAVRRSRAHLLDGKRVRALLAADVSEQPVGFIVAGRALVQVVD